MAAVWSPRRHSPRRRAGIYRGGATLTSTNDNLVSARDDLVAANAEVVIGVQHGEQLSDNVAPESVLSGGLWRAHADPNQLENSILNIAINARDAMPEGGKLTIKTSHAFLDDEYAASHFGVSAGHNVLICVTDDTKSRPRE